MSVLRCAQDRDNLAMELQSDQHSARVRAREDCQARRAWDGHLGHDRQTSQYWKHTVCRFTT